MIYSHLHQLRLWPLQFRENYVKEGIKKNPSTSGKTPGRDICIHKSFARSEIFSCEADNTPWQWIAKNLHHVLLQKENTEKMIHPETPKVENTDLLPFIFHNRVKYRFLVKIISYKMPITKWCIMWRYYLSGQWQQNYCSQRILFPRCRLHEYDRVMSMHGCSPVQSQAWLGLHGIQGSRGVKHIQPCTELCTMALKYRWRYI